MKYSIKTCIILFIIIFSIPSCDDNNSNSSATNFGEEITINYNQTIDLGATNIQITLHSMDDSRCPNDVICVWEGVARAGFTLSENSFMEDFELNVRGLCDTNCGESKEIGNYNIEIIDISPYPSANTIVTYENYEATIIVTEI